VKQTWGMRRQFVICNLSVQRACARSYWRKTHGGLELAPLDVLVDLGLGGIVAEDTEGEDLGLALGEVAVAKAGDGAGGRLGEGGQEDDADEDGEDTLELWGSVDCMWS
jgi:hypothetical protein